MDRQRHECLLLSFFYWASRAFKVVQKAASRCWRVWCAATLLPILHRVSWTISVNWTLWHTGKLRQRNGHILQELQKQVLQGNVDLSCRLSRVILLFLKLIYLQFCIRYLDRGTRTITQVLFTYKTPFSGRQWSGNVRWFVMGGVVSSCKALWVRSCTVTCSLKGTGCNSLPQDFRLKALLCFISPSNPETNRHLQCLWCSVDRELLLHLCY